jgi:hypothetical protein
MCGNMLLAEEMSNHKQNIITFFIATAYTIYDIHTTSSTTPNNIHNTQHYPTPPTAQTNIKEEMATLYQKVKSLFLNVLGFFSQSDKKKGPTKAELEIADVQTKLTECLVSIDKLPKINQTIEQKTEPKPEQKTEPKPEQKKQ